MAMAVVRIRIGVNVRMCRLRCLSRGGGSVVAAVTQIVRRRGGASGSGTVASTGSVPRNGGSSIIHGHIGSHQFIVVGIDAGGAQVGHAETHAKSHTHVANHMGAHAQVGTETWHGGQRGGRADVVGIGGHQAAGYGRGHWMVVMVFLLCRLM